MLPGRRLFVHLLLCALALAACGDDTTGQPDAPPPPQVDAAPADAAPDLTGPLFDPARVIEVAVELPPASWDMLRVQTRSVADIFGNCLMGPFPDPFTYFPAKVTIDGQTLDNVGVRKKGFLGSLDDVKPSLKVKFDEYVLDQRLAGLRSFTLNNSRQDPSFLHQCLSYQTFRAAGVPAPRCNFARVRVNGNDLGLYVHVEAVNKDFLARNFADAEGNLYEGTLSDFRPGWTATFELKTNELVNDRTDLEPVVDALARPDPQLLGALDPLLDVDGFLTFWATEMLVAHWDGYASNTNNFLAYHDPASGLFQLIPWGADATFVNGDSPWSGGPSSVQATGLLARRLYLLPETRDRYVARLRSLLAATWKENDLLAEVDRMEDLITPIADPDGSKGLAEKIEEVRGFVRARRGQIDGELAAGPPPWNEPLRDPPCFVPIGDASGTFSTTWGTAGAPNPFATGSGTLMGTVNGMPLAVGMVGATAGMDPNVTPPDPPKVQLVQVATLADGTAAIVVFQVDPALYAPATDLAIDWGGVMGLVFRFTPSTGTFELVALFSDGTLHLGMASMTDGAPVTGSFTGNLIKSPF